MPPPPTIREPRKKFLAAGLVALLALAALYGLTGYDALLTSDSWAYLRYARTLARGTFFDNPEVYSVFRPLWPATGRLELKSGLRHISGGRIFFGYELGFPLLLAAAIRLFGFHAAFFVNPVLLVLSLAGAFLAVRLAFASDPDRDGIALLSLAILLLLPPDRLEQSAIKVLRDLPALALMIAGTCCLLRGGRRPVRGSTVFLGTLFFSGAAAVRFNYLPNLLPAAAFLGAALLRNRAGGREAARAALAFVAGISVLVLAIAVQDLAQQGELLVSLRKIHSLARVLAGGSRGLFSFYNIPGNGEWYLGYLWRVYSPALILLALLGAAAGFRNPAVSCLLVPIGVLQFLIFSAFVYKSSRYLLPVYFLLAVFASAGIFRALRAAAGLRRPSPGRSRRALLLLIGALALAAAVREGLPLSESRLLAVLVPAALSAELVFAAFSSRPGRSRAGGAILAAALGLAAFRLLDDTLTQPRFQIPDAERLRRECERFVPPRSLVLAASNLKQNIDAYTSSTSLSLYQLFAPWGLPPERAVAMVIGAGIPVFGFDNLGSSDAKEMLETLENFFDLLPVAEWKSRDLKVDAPGFSGRDTLCLFRIEPWSARETVCPLPPSPSGPRLLAILPRRVWWDDKRKTLEARLDGRPLRGRVEDDLTFVLAETPEGGRPPARLSLRSDRGLPASVSLAWSADLEAGLTIDLGRRCSRGYPEWWFLPEGFLESPRSGNYRSLRGPARIALPPFAPGGTSPRLKLRMRNRLEEKSALSVELSLDGVPFASLSLPASREWRVEEAPIPLKETEVGRAWLAITPFRPAPGAAAAPAAREAGGVDIDWLAVEWPRAGPERTAAGPRRPEEE